MPLQHPHNSSLVSLPTPPESVSDNDADSDPFPSLEASSTPSSPYPWLKRSAKDILPPQSAPRTPHRPPSIQLLATPNTASPYELLSPSLSPSPHPSQTLSPLTPSTRTTPSTPAHLTAFSRAYRPRRWRAFLDSEPFWLTLYFLFNLGLTLYNKLVLVRFPFPYTLTALHAFAGTIGSYIAMELGYFTPNRLSSREAALLTAFSFLYTINIAVSNLSLQLVTVPFHQVIRAATPIFIIILSPVLLHRPLPGAPTLLSLLPVTAGVALATYGDYYFTLTGLLLTLLGTLLAALKTIATNALQTGASFASHSHSLSIPHSPSTKPSRRQFLSRIPGLSHLSLPHTRHTLPSTRILPRTWRGHWRLPRLHPLDLLLRMSPLAFIQCVYYAHLSGELERVRAWSAGASDMPMLGGAGMDGRKALALAVNGAMAFGLNVVSFTANSKVGPLSITVAANIKQVLTILLSVSLFNLTITPPNAIGIGLTLMGGAWYAAVQYREKRRGRAG